MSGTNLKVTSGLEWMCFYRSFVWLDVNRVGIVAAQDNFS